MCVVPIIIPTSILSTNWAFRQTGSYDNPGLQPKPTILAFNSCRWTLVFNVRALKLQDVIASRFKTAKI